METFDVIIVNIYLLAIFSTLIKQKTVVNIYRLLKFFVVVLFGLLVALFFTVPDAYEGFVTIAKVVPLFLLVVIMVQTEVRLLMNFVGVKTGLLLSNTIEEEVKAELIRSVDFLSARKVGALITFERAVSLQEFIQTAFPIQAPLNAELIETIFMPQTPLHDGAIIIKGNRVECAGTYFPPSENPDIPKYLGSRHRAAIGISEVTDSITIIVSEQTGYISVAIDGYLDQDISKESLILYLEKYLQN